MGSLGLVTESEPNDQSAKATPFTIGEALTGSISPSFDVDWFRFHGDQGQTAIIYLDSLESRLDVALRLWCDDGETRLAYSTSVNVRQRILLYTLTHTGDYFVTIAPHNDSTGTYRMFSGWARRDGERGRDQRDVFVSHSDDGTHWSSPAMATDDPAGYDDWLPELAVGADGDPYLAWLDWREGDPAACGAASNVRLARSEDGGDRWLPTGLVTDVSTLWSGVLSNLSPNMGDYIGLMADEQGILPAWADGRDGDPDVFAAFWPLAGAARRITPLAGEPQSGGVLVRWLAPPRLPVVATVYRRNSGQAFTALTDITSAPDGTLSFLDVDLQPGFRYHYELGVRTTEGETRVGAQSIDVPGPPGRALSIERLSPNPSDGAFRVAFHRPGLQPARVEVLDVGGRRVLAIDLGEEYGTRGVLDLGRGGSRLDPGLYLVRLIQAGESVSTKAVVVR
jgi:hypothetical protein